MVRPDRLQSDFQGKAARRRSERAVRAQFSTSAAWHRQFLRARAAAQDDRATHVLRARRTKIETVSRA